MEVWCSMPTTGVNVSSQPSNQEVREWKSKLEAALNYLSFMEKIQIKLIPECIKELRKELEEEK